MKITRVILLFIAGLGVGSMYPKLAAVAVAAGVGIAAYVAGYLRGTNKQ